MPQSFDIAAVGHAIVDIQSSCDDAFLAKHGLPKGAMTLIDAHTADHLYQDMSDHETASGGSAGNTIAGAAMLGAKCAYIGKVAFDVLGDVFNREISKQGVWFKTPFLHEDPTPTGRCLINVTEDGQRTMATFLGAAALVGPNDIEEAVISNAKITYLEGYLFDTPSGREAFAKASFIARNAGKKVAMTLSDMFVVERWRADLLAFIEGNIDIVFANEAELLALYRADSSLEAERAIRSACDMAFITRGEKGASIIHHEETINLEAQKSAHVIDTTGAGDQFAAGALYGLTNGFNLRRSGEIGIMAASEVISHFGPRPHQDLKKLMKEQGFN